MTGTQLKVLTLLRNAGKLWGKQLNNIMVTVHWGGNQLESVTDSHFVVGKDYKSSEERGVIIAGKQLKAVMVTAHYGDDAKSTTRHYGGKSVRSAILAGKGLKTVKVTPHYGEKSTRSSDGFAQYGGKTTKTTEALSNAAQ